MTKQPPYDAALREAVRIRMSPPNRERVAEIARDTGITAQTIYNWRSQWQKQGQLVPASPKPPEKWSAADKLAAVIQAAGLSGSDLGSFCRERGLYPKQVARWRQAAEDANGPSAPSIADQRELQRKIQELIRRNRQLERELQKKEKALTEAATLLMLSKKFNQIFQPDEEH
jgi:transposase-like protein